MGVVQYIKTRGISMNKIEIKILAIEVVKESDLLDQEKRELVNLIKETQEFPVIERVLESYDLLEKCDEEEENESEEGETEECHSHGLGLKDLDECIPDSANITVVKKGEEASESAMGPLKTPRDQDLDELKEEISIPSVLDEKFLGRKWVKGGMKQSVVNFLKKQQGPPEMKIPSSTQTVRPGLRTRLSQTLVRIRPEPKPVVAVP